MKRLLCIVGSMDIGGAETFLMKIYRTLDKTKYQMDFCVAKKERGAYDDEIEQMGGRIYRITPKTEGVARNFNDVKKIVHDNRYENVMRISQNSLSALELLAARFGGAKNLIFRSSNSSVYGDKKEEIIHRIFRPIANIISNEKIAPSKEAGDFMFGRANYVIIKNGLDINEYEFSKASRKKYREEFGAKDKTVVIGHVGRFSDQKNHKYLIDVFGEYHSRNPDSMLWLFGDGELVHEIKRYIIRKRLEDNVRMLGTRKDINRIYSAMDCFVFPSLFEGMPNTVIEAQASGLPCVVSDTITKSCAVTDNVRFVPLGDGAAGWAEKIWILDFRKRKHSKFKIMYDIQTVLKDFITVAYE